VASRCTRLSNSTLMTAKSSNPSTSVFFFQAEDGIRDGHVTGVQTCALPISPARAVLPRARATRRTALARCQWADPRAPRRRRARSEERRVGKEWACGWGAARGKEKGEVAGGGVVCVGDEAV